MRGTITRAKACLVAAALLVGSGGVVLPASPAGAAPLPSQSLTEPEASGKAAADYGRLPLSFEINQGQADPAVKFASHGKGRSLFLTATGAVLSLGDDVIRISLEGADPAPEMVGTDRLPGVANYLVGDDPARWHTGVPTFARVEHRQVYPGVDHVWYGHEGELEHDFVLAAGVDPSLIRLRYSGVDNLRVDDAGNLVMDTPSGTLSELAPSVYQEKGGARHAVAGRYRLLSGGRVGFDIDAHDQTLPLVIDPVLVYQFVLPTGAPGCGCDEAGGIAVDAAGNAYVTGMTASSELPTEEPIQSSGAGAQDAFVSKLNADGTALVFSTYLGGSGDDFGDGIAVDSLGSAHVAGTTSSEDFPSSTGAAQTVLGGGADAFVVKLSPAGTVVEHSTFLGGEGDDSGDGIAVDPAGNAYVTGETASAAFPTTPDAFDTALGGFSDAFVTKLSSAGGLVYSTFLGGEGAGGDDPGRDNGRGIAVDGDGEAWITGTTATVDFPTRPGASQTTFGGGTDAYVTRLNIAGDDVVASTFLGGAAEDAGHAVAVFNGDAYVTGATESDNFPTLGAFQADRPGGVDGFVTRTGPTGTFLSSTYLGGGEAPPEGEIIGATADDFGDGIAVGPSGAIYVFGVTSSVDFPTMDAIDPSLSGSSDAFVTKLTAAGDALVHSTYLGGSRAERPFEVCLICLGNADINSGDIAVDSTGAAYVTGVTQSADFPTTAGAFQPDHAGGITDSFVTKISPSGTTVAYSTYLGGSGQQCDALVASCAGMDDGGIDVDGSGAAYITGTTSSASFPTEGALQETKGGFTDAFVAKLSPAGDTLVWSTYLGGNDVDTGADIAVDAAGNAYITGETRSNDFPTTTGAFQDSDPDPSLAVGAGSDAFVARVDGTGSSLTYSTYLGAAGADGGRSIAVDAVGAAYITGDTTSGLFPTTPGAPQGTNAGNGDVFIAKLNLDGTGPADLAHSTYLGGSGPESAGGITVDSEGDAYVTGLTSSSDLPTANPIQATCTPLEFETCLDAFVAKVDPDGGPLVWSTYLGGSFEDFGRDIAVDTAGAAYVTGGTSSLDFPTTSGAVQATKPDGQPVLDAFVTKIDPAGSALEYSTYLGGSGFENCIAELCIGVGVGGIDVDASGAAYVTGMTSSADFPTRSPSQASLDGPTDAFVTKLSPPGNTLVWSTYLGGSGADSGVAIAVDGSGAAYVMGATGPDILEGETPDEGTSAFVVKLAPTADLAVTKTADGPGRVGEPLTYTITVDNVGELDAVDVVMTDLLPAGVDLVSVETSQGTCAGTVCQLGAITAGGTATITIVVTPTVEGTLENTATVTSPDDPNAANDSSTVFTDVEANPCLVPTIVGTDGPDRLWGTSGDDIIDGLGGDDRIDGRGGNDVICGGAGDDIEGGEGDDTVLVLNGFVGSLTDVDVTVDGGPGNDVVNVLNGFGGSLTGVDVTVDGGSGDDILNVLNGVGGALTGVDVTVDGGSGGGIINVLNGFGGSLTGDADVTLDGGSGANIINVGNGFGGFLTAAAAPQDATGLLHLAIEGGAIVNALNGFSGPLPRADVTVDGGVIVNVLNGFGGSLTRAHVRVDGADIVNVLNGFGGFFAAGAAPQDVTGSLDVTVESGPGNDIINVLDGFGGSLTDADVTVDGGSGDDIINVLNGFGGSLTDADVTVDGGSGDDTMNVLNEPEQGSALPGISVKGGDGNDTIQVTGGAIDVEGGRGDDQITVFHSSAGGSLTAADAAQGCPDGMEAALTAAAERAPDGKGFPSCSELILMAETAPTTTAVTSAHEPHDACDVDGDSGDDTLLVISDDCDVDGDDGADAILTIGSGGEHGLTVDGGTGPDSILAIAQGFGGLRAEDAEEEALTVIKGGSGDDDILAVTNAFGGFLVPEATAAAASDFVIDGGSGDDVIQAGGGAHRLIGGSGDDRVTGYVEELGISEDDGVGDVIEGGSGDDILTGGNGDDRIKGGAGDDTLTGSGGADHMSGEEGRDTLDGVTDEDPEAGDRLSGGSGRDTCVPSVSDVRISC